MVIKWIDDLSPLLCTHPAISLESDSVQTLQTQTINRGPLCVFYMYHCMQTDHIIIYL